MTREHLKRSSILDRNFKYVPAAATDIRKTFARVRREQRLQEERRRAADAGTQRKVATLARRPS